MATFTDELPDAAEFEGKTATDQATGQMFVSDGQEWREVTAEQVSGQGFPAPQTGPTRLQQMLRGGLSMGAALAPSIAMPGAGPGITLLRRAMESVVPMAMEVGIQQAGLAPESGTDIGLAGLVPPTTRLGLGAPSAVKSGIRGGIGFVAPATVRDQGVDIAKGMVRGEASGPLFRLVRQQGPVSVAPVLKSVNKALQSELKMSSPNRVATTLLKNLQHKLTAPQLGGQIQYDDLAREMQRMRSAAQSASTRGNNVTANALYESRSEILNAMDKVSPLIKRANSAFRREEAVKQLAFELRKSNAGNALRNLIESDRLFRETFDAKARKELIGIADSITRIGTGATMGAANRFLQAVTEPLAEALQGPVGRSMIQLVMRNPRDPKFIPRLAAIIAAEGGRSAFGRVGEMDQDVRQILGVQPAQ